VAKHDVSKGRLRLSLAPGEHHAGLTVNEYETLLMRHDLSEVLRDPLRFMAEKAGHMLGNPRAIPSRTLDYAKYDFVRVFNRLVDALGLKESFVESVLSRAIAMPASRFLRMKRSVSLLVSVRVDTGSAGNRAGSSKAPTRARSSSSGTASIEEARARARRHAHALRLLLAAAGLDVPGHDLVHCLGRRGRCTQYRAHHHRPHACDSHRSTPLKALIIAGTARGRIPAVTSRGTDSGRPARGRGIRMRCSAPVRIRKRWSHPGRADDVQGKSRL
jgi:hypothetical protein